MIVTMLKLFFLTIASVTFFSNNSMDLQNIELSYVQALLELREIFTKPIWQEHVPVIIDTVKRGALVPLKDPSHEEYFECHLMGVAARYNSIELATLLLARKADAVTRCLASFDPVLVATGDHSKLDPKFIKILLDNGYPITTRIDEDQTHLHRAIKLDLLEIAKIFLEKGADINAPGFLGKRPLHYAYSPEQIKLLIEKGADVNAQDTRGNTPLHDCYIEENAEFLLDAGANFDMQNNNAELPVDFALRFGLKKLIGAIENKKKQIQHRHTVHVASVVHNVCLLDELGLARYIAEYAQLEIEECNFALSQKLDACKRT